MLSDAVPDMKTTDDWKGNENYFAFAHLFFWPSGRVLRCPSLSLDLRAMVAWRDLQDSRYR